MKYLIFIILLVPVLAVGGVKEDCKEAVPKWMERNTRIDAGEATEICEKFARMRLAIKDTPESVYVIRKGKLACALRKDYISTYNHLFDSGRRYNFRTIMAMGNSCLTISESAIAIIQERTDFDNPVVPIAYFYSHEYYYPYRGWIHVSEMVRGDKYMAARVK
ncbi:MAG: hypothetical protein COB04_16015 [Gammaproteobacteria bacterium]|nr:MAG: hypothetical protein COB04_16015 [Gammaproteobacteria bacterium]